MNCAMCGLELSDVPHDDQYCIYYYGSENEEHDFKYTTCKSCADKANQLDLSNIPDSELEEYILEHLQKKSELKPCPFCGRGDVAVFKDGNHEYYVCCIRGCGCTLPAPNDYFTSEKAAIEAWNKRKDK